MKSIAACCIFELVGSRVFLVVIFLSSMLFGTFYTQTNGKKRHVWLSTSIISLVGVLDEVFELPQRIKKHLLSIIMSLSLCIILNIMWAISKEHVRLNIHETQRKKKINFGTNCW